MYAILIPFIQDLPPTAAGGIEMIAAILASLAGLAATAITDALKRLPFLTDGDKSLIGGPLGNLTTALISIGSGYIVGYLGQLAGILDESGLWQVVLFTWPTAKVWFEASQFRRNISSAVNKR